MRTPTRQPVPRAERRVRIRLPEGWLQLLEQRNRITRAELGQAPYDWEVCGL